MSSIAFIDPISQIPYGGCERVDGALGGTEATVLRIARDLALDGHQVLVAQRARQTREVDETGVSLCPYDPVRGLEQSMDKVVLLRADKLMSRLRRQHPTSSLWLWLHCFPGRHRRGMVQRARQADFRILTVSETLRQAVLEGSPAMRGEGLVEVVYNPVDVGCVPVARARDPNKLVFFSSPHKGLEQVVRHFRHLRQHDFPDLTLYVANPGYLPSACLEDQGIVNLGSLSHSAVLRHVAEAFCVFMPQSTFAETFGLVFAEANALGTPVLTHPLGAAAEVLSAEQLVNCESADEVAALFRRWRQEGPPRVTLNPDFAMEAVKRRWLEVLETEALERTLTR